MTTFTCPTCSDLHPIRHWPSTPDFWGVLQELSVTTGIEIRHPLCPAVVQWAHSMKDTRNRNPNQLLVTGRHVRGYHVHILHDWRTTQYGYCICEPDGRTAHEDLSCYSTRGAAMAAACRWISRKNAR